jgi:hypothetical protein
MAPEREAYLLETGLPAGASADGSGLGQQAVLFFLAGQAGEFDED